jgi:signal transduction histidine kinase
VVAYPDGRLVLLDTLKTPMKSGGGLVGISRDITERHQAESLLRAESSRLSTLIQSMEGGVLVEDERRCIHLVNRVFMRLFDIPGNPEDIIGADCRLALKMVAPMFARPDTVMATLEGLTRGNEPARSIIIEMKGQRFLECDFSPIAIGGNAYNYLWHYRDITSRRRAELELQQRDVMLRGLAETTRQLLAGLDDFDNSIIEAFRIIAETAQVDGVRILQLDSQRAGAGRTISQRYMWSRYRGTVRPSEELQNLSVDPDHTRWLNELGRGGMLAGNLSSFPENERRALEGRGVGSLLITPLFLEGVLWGALEFSTRELRDWTPVDRNILRMAADSVGYALQRKRSRDELNQALSEAERLAIEADKASKATTDFLASMSHEIRTPLNGLVGYANLLRSTGLSERQTYLLGGLDRSSEILLALINDILDLSKISAGQISLDSSPMMPAGIVQDVMEALRPRVEEKRLKLVFEPLGLPAHGFLGDERRLKQVLLNLLGNAIKFTASGGITITVSATSPDAAGGDWRLDFAVKDSGIGIARDNLSRLFLPFSQAANDISRRFGGTGLGLSICRQLVTLMGGQIGVESVVGEGSTFRFHIMCPAAEAPEQPAQGHACGGTARVGDDMPLRILVADDNVINQEVLSLYLEEMGYAPAIVDDGAAAFEAVKKGDIDLVFMDLRMPVMDGRESARAIRRWEAERTCRRAAPRSSSSPSPPTP